MTDRTISKGLHPGVPGVSAPRQEISQYHIDFARARRPAVGWQNIAKMLGVNVADLQRVCDRGAVAIAAVDRPPPPAEEPRKRGPVKRKTAAILVLEIMAEGGVWTAASVAEALRDPSIKTGIRNINVVLAGLRAGGYVTQAKARAPYAITFAGRRRLSEHLRLLEGTHG